MWDAHNVGIGKALTTAAHLWMLQTLTTSSSSLVDGVHAVLQARGALAQLALVQPKVCGEGGEASRTDSTADECRLCSCAAKPCSLGLVQPKVCMGRIKIKTARPFYGPHVWKPCSRLVQPKPAPHMPRSTNPLGDPQFGTASRLPT